MQLGGPEKVRLSLDAIRQLNTKRLLESFVSIDDVLRRHLTSTVRFVSCWSGANIQS